MPHACSIPGFLRLDGATTTLVLALEPDGARVLHWGAHLPEGTALAALASLMEREEAPAAPAIEAPLTLTPQLGQGFPGRPGLLAHRNGQAWASAARVGSVQQTSPGGVRIESCDPHCGIGLVHHLRLDPAGDVLEAATEITNLGAAMLALEWCAAPVLPIPPWFDAVVALEGRWAGEFQRSRHGRPFGTFLRENRRGRSSHDAFPGLLLESADGREVIGMHLGWSGNHRIAIETLPDGRACVQMGELWFPGEMTLAAGAVYRTPTLYTTASDRGENGIRAGFHRTIRARPSHARLRAKPRPIHYNTWEAVYFRQDPEVLMDLAARAAALGIERFVLDDGWFLNRRSDRAGLGDWQVDPAIFPEGLQPLIRHVTLLGMEFGLWVEPEMVNPDSDLYRAHPDWVLAAPPNPQLQFRHQLVLDFGRAEIRDHVLAQMTALLRAHAIHYLKWDMNRELSHPGGADGRPGARAHVLGLYEVLARLRAAFPDVEIESCASGGGRADYGMLAHTDRVWTSDSNDALDRLEIQRGFSLFFPPELMGAHVGPARCHITGRTLSMTMRVASALAGHFGVEADLRALDADETRVLAAGIALHKRFRPLLHHGLRLDLPTPENEHAFMVQAVDGAQALLFFFLLAESRAGLPGRLRLQGLEPAARYRLALVWPESGMAASDHRPESPILASLRAGIIVEGAGLMQIGLQIPRLAPQSGFVAHLVREDA